MDLMFWWTGLFAHVIFWGALVLSIVDKIWAAFTVTLMDSWSCQPERWAVYARCFWRELVHTFRRDARIGPWGSKSVGGYEVTRPFGWPRKIKSND